MTTDAEIAVASSWQRTMTRDKLSECLVPQRLKSRVGKPEKRWTLVNQRLWKITNQVNNQFPQFEWADHRVQEQAGSGSRANEANTDDRETKRVRFTEGRGLKGQSEDAEELAARAEEQHLDADVEVGKCHKTWRVEDVVGDAADAAPEQMNSFVQSKTEVFEKVEESLRPLCMV